MRHFTAVNQTCCVPIVAVGSTGGVSPLLQQVDILYALDALKLSPAAAAVFHPVSAFSDSGEEMKTRAEGQEIDLEV